MAEPVKIKFEYQNPENVEAEVPGAQKIREAPPQSETDENQDDNAPNNENNGETSKELSQNGRHPEGEGSEVITRHDRRHVFSGKRIGIHGEPVMLDKLDDKKSKTKIPISRFRQTVEKVKEERRNARKEHESHIPVRRSSIPKPIKETKSPSTTVKKEITVTKSLTKNHLAEPIVTETTITKETIEHNDTKTHANTSQAKLKLDIMEPEDEFDKIYAEIVTDTPTEVILDDNLMDPKVEDPDKLESKFEEIIHDYDEHKLEPIDPEVVRRSRLPVLKRKSQQDIELSAQADRTSKIIAARDKLRLRYSMNKDESFEEALDKELNNVEINNGSDSKENKDNNFEKEAPKVDIKTEKETKHDVITSPNSKTELTRQFTKTVSTSSSHEQENVESSSQVETTKIKEMSTNESNEMKINKQYNITEENIIKGSIKIGIPVFDSYVHEFSETNETAKTTEIKTVLSYASNIEELSVTNNISEIRKEINTTDSKANVTNKLDTMSETSVSEITNNSKFKTSDSNVGYQISESENYMVESVKTENSESLKSTNMNTGVKEPATVNETKINNDVQLRSKVERTIGKIESREIIEIEGNERESINELRKKKSVMSKIAMFERKPEESIFTKSPKKETKLPELITKDRQRVEHVHIHTPLIVDEVFKPFSADISINDRGEIPIKNNEVTTIVRTERVTVKGPDAVHYATESKVQIETESSNQKKTTNSISSQSNRETLYDKSITGSSVQTNINSEVSEQKVEIATKTDVSTKESNITNDFTSPKPNADKIIYKDINKVPITLRISTELNKTNDIDSARTNANKFDFNAARNKTLSPTRLSMTKELQSPIIIPGFKPVSKLLRSFESNQETNNSFTKRSFSRIEHKTVESVKVPEIAEIISTENQAISTQVSQTGTYSSEIYDDFNTVNDYKSLDDVFSRDSDMMKLKLRQEDDLKRAKSLAELDLGDAVKGKVNNIILRMKSVDIIEVERREAINKKEMPRKRSVSEKIALFEGKITPSRSESTHPLRIFKDDIPPELRTVQKTQFRTAHNTKAEVAKHRIEVQREKSVTEVIESKVVEELRSNENDQEQIQKKIEELSNAKIKYGKVEDMPCIELSNGITMPAIAIGTALLEPRLIYHIITAAIDLGYRAIDTAFIYGNEREVGEAIRAKIADGTVKREELYIISKLWSTYHRTDLVEGACRASLDAMGLNYFDLYLIHNPMSFKEGVGPIPKIATVIQYSAHDYLDAWYGMELLVPKGLVRAIGVSNFNSVQLQRVLDKGRIKPVINQVECHPYLSQQRLDLFCSERNVTLSCFGVLGSKGTPLELKNGQPAVIDDALIQVMASGLGVTPAQLLISYQLENGHSVVVKASSAHHLHGNLLAAKVSLTAGQVDPLHALNRNKRMFTFKGMGDTHKNYPFNAAF